MLDSIDINFQDKPSASTATRWFDAISPNFFSAANLVGGDPFYFVSSRRNDTIELTPSTIRYNEDSGASPRDILSETRSPVEPVRERSRVEVSEAEQGGPTSHGERPLDNTTPSADNYQRSRHGDLYEDAMRAQIAKRQWAAVEQMRQMMLETAKVERDCPFRPQLSSYAAKIQRPAELAPHNRVYNELMRREEWRTKKRQEHIRRELEGCTFRPLTLRAAMLKSSAHTHDSHVFSKLYHHHEEQNHFVREVQPYVVEQLERHMLFKSLANKPLPEDKINSVVERLFSHGVVVQPDEVKRRRSQSTSPPFKPRVNVNSERIVAKQRQGGQVVEEVVERLLKPPVYSNRTGNLRRQLEATQENEELKPMRSEYVRGLQELLQRERRRSFIEAKFNVLSSAINKERQSREGSQRTLTEHRAEELVRAAVIILSPDEAEELRNIILSSGANKLNKEGFIALCEKAVEGLSNPHASPLGRVPPPRIHAMEANLTDDGNGSYAGARKKFQRGALSPEELEEVRARRVERKRQMAEEENQKRQAMIEEEMRQCTFRPPPPRKVPRECHVNHKVDVKTTKADELRRAHIQKTLEGEEHAGGAAAALPTASARELFGDGGSHPRLHRSQSANTRSPRAMSTLHTKPAFVAPAEASFEEGTFSPKRNRYEKPRRSHTAHSDAFLRKKDFAGVPLKDRSSRRSAAVSSDRSSEDAAAADTTSRGMKKCESVAEATTVSPRLYRDVISEHAAFGRDGALTEFGRELILRQLREYRNKR
ncbi:hypothetical protein BCY84_03140 [Trypanosoma cruzi cruzi]|nr:hypothetical protein BCY84_03140 [Trypanosoma cruzi cruzi]